MKILKYAKPLKFGLKSQCMEKLMGIERSTFCLMKIFNLIQSWRKVKVNGHAEEVLNSID